MNKKMIEIPAGKTVERREINGKQVLVLVDEKDNRPVTERIKTFEDACRELGEDHPMVWAYGNTEDNMPDITAYMKLRIITAALNEGWHPQFTKDECRWYPWFCLWTDEELSYKSDGWKQEHAPIDLDNYQGAWAGFACAGSYYAPSATRASVGSRLCYKSEALADYSGSLPTCGRTFILSENSRI